MVTIAPLVGFVVAPLTALVVYADASRRGLGGRVRSRWTVAVGVASFVGFLVPAGFDDVLVRGYLYGVKSRPVVTAPYEVLFLHLAVGMAIAFGVVLLYAVGSRSWPRLAD